jgi:homoserine dehydrogenase
MSRFYIRLQVQDRPGVLAKVSTILCKYSISVSSVTQKENQSPSVQMIMLTHKASASDMAKAIDEITQIQEVSSSPVVFRIEDAN